MADKNLKKILEFFKEIDCEIKYLLVNAYDSPFGTGLFGEDIELPKYAAIYDLKKDIFSSDENFRRKMNFEGINHFEISGFYRKNCKSVEGILEELKGEGYHLIYSIF